MAEAAAAIYAVETVAEGAAVGAIAVSQSTTPLHVRFRKLDDLPNTTPWNTVAGASLDVVKGRAYMFGGDSDSGPDSASLRIISLPSDIENGQSDYQLIRPELEPVRPLQRYSLSTPETDAEGFQEVSTQGRTHDDSQQSPIRTRSAHASTSIDSTIYMLAGREPKGGNREVKPETADLLSCDQVYAFSTQTNKWSILQANISRCSQGIPPSRTRASCTSTPHPEPQSAIDITIQAHGTIFLHGGYDTHGQALRDTWAFDVSSKVWTRWPDLPENLPEEVPGEGRVACVGKRLWRAGDGFGKMLCIDFDIKQANVVGEVSGPHLQETEVVPDVAEWGVLTADDRTHAGASSDKPLVNKTENLPVPRQGAGFVPVKTGAGRSFLLYFMGQDGRGSALRDVWSFQIKAEEKTPAAFKDTIRNLFSKDTGENKWAPCDVVESTKEDGQVPLPTGLAHFAVDGWEDLGGGNILLVGGTDASGQSHSECWVLSVG